MTERPHCHACEREARKNQTVNNVIVAVLLAFIILAVVVNCG